MSEQNDMETEYFADKCPADAVRDYIEEVIRLKKEGKTEKEIPKKIIFSPESIEYLINSEYVDYYVGSETGDEVSFGWNKTEALPALLVKVKRKDEKYFLTYIKEDASETDPDKSEEFIWDEKDEKGKKGTLAIIKENDVFGKDER